MPDEKEIEVHNAQHNRSGVNQETRKNLRGLRELDLNFVGVEECLDFIAVPDFGDEFYFFLGRDVVVFATNFGKLTGGGFHDDLLDGALLDELAELAEGFFGNVFLLVLPHPRHPTAGDQCQQQPDHSHSAEEIRVAAFRCAARFR